MSIFSKTGEINKYTVDRREGNLLILMFLTDYLTYYPDMRFGQTLYVTDINNAGQGDPFPESPRVTLKRARHSIEELYTTIAKDEKLPPEVKEKYDKHFKQIRNYILWIKDSNHDETTIP